MRNEIMNSYNYSNETNYIYHKRQDRCYKFGDKLMIRYSIETTTANPVWDIKETYLHYLVEILNKKQNRFG